MSSDLLAEFDSFYRAPQSGAPNKTSAPSTSRPTSAFEDLSFLGTPNPTQSNQSHSQPQWNIPVSKPVDDIWGNFEAMGAGSTQYATATSASDPWGGFQPPGSLGGARQQGPGSKKTGYEGSLQGRYKAETRSSNPSIVRRPTIDLFSSNIADLAESTPAGEQNGALPSYPSTRTTSQYTNTKILPEDRSNVLFDAADELNGGADDDDFGDFETVSSPTPQIDLLQIGSPIKAEKPGKRPSELLMTSEGLKTSLFPYPQAPKSPSFKERNPFADLAVATPSISSSKKEDAPKTQSPVTAWPVYEPSIPAAGPYQDSPAANNPEEEDWGDFEDLPSETKNTEPPKKGIEVDAWAWDAVDSQPAPVPAPSAEVPPPTNIPPPSVLLAIFPQLFNLPQSSLFQAVANQPFALKNRILSDLSTIDFLRAYILLATVAARIMAGRKLRWKRDIHLSQAMKIGPAVAHGRGGMKLTGVDKAEATREEREAADLVRIWREQVGRLRSAVAAANSSLHDQSTHLAVPEITETMTVKTEGALTAPKACVVCGLKREERIPKVDFQVEDSFGEWWVEHWGHRACRNFWQEHEGKLKQR
jgi:hypothetical protein